MLNNYMDKTNKEIILDLYKNFRFNKDFGLNLYGQGEASSMIVKELMG